MTPFRPGPGPSQGHPASFTPLEPQSGPSRRRDSNPGRWFVYAVGTEDRWMLSRLRGGRRFRPGLVPGAGHPAQVN
jgi:hypothetical protein